MTSIQKSIFTDDIVVLLIKMIFQWILNHLYIFCKITYYTSVDYWNKIKIIHFPYPLFLLQICSLKSCLHYASYVLKGIWNKVTKNFETSFPMFTTSASKNSLPISSSIRYTLRKWKSSSCTLRNYSSQNNESSARCAIKFIFMSFPLILNIVLIRYLFI